MFASRLVAFYPGQDIGNPEIVLAGIIQLFQQYPAHIAERAVSPVYGLPKRHKFIPRIAEIAEFLEAEAAPIRREEERKARTLALPEPPIDRSQRKTYDELEALCAADGLIIGKRGAAPTAAGEQAAFREKFGITQEQWNAIPDACR